jgi:hypothetical protein
VAAIRVLYCPGLAVAKVCPVGAVLSNAGLAVKLGRRDKAGIHFRLLSNVTLA